MSVMVLSLGLLLSTSTLAAPPAADYLVTPGVSLGKIKLGMTKAEVRKALTSEMIIVHKPNEKVLFQPDEEAYEQHPGE